MFDFNFGLLTLLVIKGVRESTLSVGKSRARNPTQNKSENQKEKTNSTLNSQPSTTPTAQTQNGCVGQNGIFNGHMAKSGGAESSSPERDEYSDEEEMTLSIFVKIHSDDILNKRRIRASHQY